MLLGVLKSKLCSKKRRKNRHDASAHDLQTIPIGATVTYLNKDLKTWSIGKVESHEGKSYIVAMEEGRLVSHNRVHLCKTNVSFGMPTTSPNKPFVPRLDMPIKPPNIITNTGPPSTISPKTKAKLSTPVSTPPRVELRMRSRRLVKKPPKLDL